MMLGFFVKENDKVRWSSRWDYLLESMPHTNIQWFRSDMRSLQPVFYLRLVVYLFAFMTRLKPGGPVS